MRFEWGANLTKSSKQFGELFGGEGRTGGNLIGCTIPPLAKRKRGNFFIKSDEIRMGSELDKVKQTVRGTVWRRRPHRRESHRVYHTPACKTQAGDFLRTVIEKKKERRAKIFLLKLLRTGEKCCILNKDDNRYRLKDKRKENYGIRIHRTV